MQSSHFHASLFWIALLAAAPACGFSFATVDRTTTQNSLVPSPSGPRAIGPMLDDGAIGIEAGYSYQPVLDGNRVSRVAGANGELAVEHTVRAHAAFGLGERVELGVNLEGAAASWATARASDLGPDDRLRSYLLKGGVTARALLAGDRLLGLGALVELDLTGLSYVTEVHEDAWVKSPGVAPVGTYIGARESARVDTEAYAIARVGLFGMVQPDSLSTISFGLLVQNVPRFVGAEDVTFTCDNVSATTCADHINPADFPNLKTEVALTAFVSVGFELGPVHLMAQLFAHPVMSDVSTWHTTPFGLDFGIRYVL